MKPTPNETALLLLRLLSFQIGGNPERDELVARLSSLVAIEDLSSAEVMTHRSRMVEEKLVAKNGDADLRDITFTSGTRAAGCKIGGFEQPTVMIWSIEQGLLRVPFRLLPPEIAACYPFPEHLLPMIQAVDETSQAAIEKLHDTELERDLLIQENEGHLQNQKGDKP